MLQTKEGLSQQLCNQYILTVNLLLEEHRPIMPMAIKGEDKALLAEANYKFWQFSEWGGVDLELEKGTINLKDGLETRAHRITQTFCNDWKRKKDLNQGLNPGKGKG